ncbi:hypothetical protein [Bradyrhizobium japonicum]|uniref:hypothetical protein n=1 Tax=Bradyrhizobium japonicum TaxID=375 RepID=UPI0012BC2BFB|nr:hypothetical protein [Bradyrhizobium japonicum]
MLPDAGITHPCDAANLPLFCPTGQTDFAKPKKRNAANGTATVHGVVFAVFGFGESQWLAPS